MEGKVFFVKLFFTLNKLPIKAFYVKVHFCLRRFETQEGKKFIQFMNFVSTRGQLKRGGGGEGGGC